MSTESLQEHIIDANAHSNMTIDGNAHTAKEATSLDEHLVDTNAHQNIKIDGNAGA